MSDELKLVVEHYQKTYDLTYQLWQQRNRTFLILVGVVGVATILTYRPTDANSLLVDWIASILQITDAARLKELHDSFPFALLQAILLIAVFYLMVNLFHHALYVLRNYAYLGALEKEIRMPLIPKGYPIAFTRESDFYWGNRPWLLSTVKWIYIFFLGMLLSAFLIGRVIGDIYGGSLLLVATDFAIGLPTLVYFVGYAWHTVRLDSQKAISPPAQPKEG